MAQVLNQFIKGLQSSILRFVRLCHPTNLQDAIAFARNFESTKQESFDKSTPIEGKNIEQISQPSKQTKSNILPATITKNTTLAAIFSFNINNLNIHSLFSGAVINQDKLIMALYTDARVRGIDIKLILNSRSAGSIITKQLIDQLDH
ncbi:hypothetical protein G9A89_018342 [Geosiphon pyriformis]|nr:hypothetical protein G9A89_018342 [Geosiphon pyriformis]